MPRKKIMTQKQIEDMIVSALEKRDGEVPLEVMLLVTKTAMDIHHLMQVNEQLSRCADDWVQLVPGSTGQMRQEINPLLAHRDKTSRTVSDDLDALQFTPRSKWKKIEGKGDANNDPMREFFKNTQY